MLMKKLSKYRGMRGKQRKNAPSFLTWKQPLSAFFLFFFFFNIVEVRLYPNFASFFPQLMRKEMLILTCYGTLVNSIFK